jgi:predicted SAM-dependent methyltransferase
MNLLNAGCGTHYAKGWVNTDVWSNEETTPDVLVQPNQPYPFEDDHFDGVFLSHVLEHIAWPDVPKFLNEISRVAKPKAPIFIVGPDVFKTLNLWRENLQPLWLVEAVLEHQDMRPDSVSEWWDGAHHHWNCHEQRVIDLLESLGFQQIETYSSSFKNNWKDKHVKNIVWPVVGRADWQFAVRCINK